MLSLLWPWVLCLIPLPMAYRIIRHPKQMTMLALRAPVLAALAENKKNERYPTWKKFILMALMFTCWISALSALSRPVWVGEPISLPTSGRDILLAVDISGSMEREDMQLGGKLVNRLVAVKAVVGNFVIERDGDRLGLILFGEKAYLQAPLTFDRKTMQTLLYEAEIGFAGQGTAIGDAIGIGIKRLQGRPDNHRVMILLTDGASNSGELNPLKAADLAARSNVKIYTVGIGAERIQEWSLFGQTITNPSADLDESTLMGIARATGGQYFRARNPAELSTIYERLNELEPIEQSVEIIRPVTSLFHWPLGLSFFSALILFALNGKKNGF
ncbi:MAG: VWA domain-containing protein [Cellvibrionales bacterium TMED148]|nr:BatB protein [Porticoccaceae bacterium]RPG91876.1 MAG: VWA domain-containing protein [Cellvibrionales bacterium TMED148]